MAQINVGEKDIGVHDIDRNEAFCVMPANYARQDDIEECGKMPQRSAGEKFRFCLRPLFLSRIFDLHALVSTCNLYGYWY